MEYGTIATLATWMRDESNREILQELCDAVEKEMDKTVEVAKARLIAAEESGTTPTISTIRMLLSLREQMALARGTDEAKTVPASVRRAQNFLDEWNVRRPPLEPTATDEDDDAFRAMARFGELVASGSSVPDGV